MMEILLYIGLVIFGIVMLLCTIASIIIIKKVPQMDEKRLSNREMKDSSNLS